MNVAPRVKRLIAQDVGEDMLALVRKNAAERGIANIETLRGNWHAMEPGKDLPVCDVAITRWSPAQGDILKMSRCATRKCYSLSTCAPRFQSENERSEGWWCRSTVDESLNTTPRPCARKYGFNVHFNLLYDHGANPTIQYVIDERRVTAPTKDALLEKLMDGLCGPRKDACEAQHAARDGRRAADRGKLAARLEPDIRQTDSLEWEYVRRASIAVLGWDPREVVS